MGFAAMLADEKIRSICSLFSSGYGQTII